MSRRFTATVLAMAVTLIAGFALHWWLRDIHLASEVTITPIEGRQPLPDFTLKIPADRYERCVNCDTKERFCPEHGTERYADFFAAVDEKPWACCPVGYVPDIVPNGPGTADNEIICVPKKSAFLQSVAPEREPASSRAKRPENLQS